ncbi:UNVERIFIED_CONTAM: calcium signaling protein kinase RAD53, putative [Hammondia hammondi]|eukprot:XP_008883197.1 calcium signaling protein kinase RAD53, putative [Hammondia hammondi]
MEREEARERGEGEATVVVEAGGGGGENEETPHEERGASEAACDEEAWRERQAVTAGRTFRSPRSGAVYQVDRVIGTGSAATVYLCRRIGQSCKPHGCEAEGGDAPSAEPTQPDRRREAPVSSETPGRGATPGNREDSSGAEGAKERGGSSDEEREKKDLFAVKVLDLRAIRLCSDFAREMQKVHREVRILQQLRHPCIANLEDVVQEEDLLFLVMEYVKGGELFYRVVEKGCFSEPQACYIMHQLVHACIYMHEKHILHRDLKPENILVDRVLDGDFFAVKVADFGLAKILTRNSLAHTLVGTPQYWAPEVLACNPGPPGTPPARQHYGAAADLWSLGVCLYVMLGGSYPFDERIAPLHTLILKGQFHFRHPRFQRVSESAKDLVRRLLTVETSRRITEKEILQHPWMLRWLNPVDVRQWLPPGASPTNSPFQVMPPLPRLAVCEPLSSVSAFNSCLPPQNRDSDEETKEKETHAWEAAAPQGSSSEQDVGLHVSVESVSDEQREPEEPAGSRRGSEAGARAAGGERRRVASRDADSDAPRQAGVPGNQSGDPGDEGCCASSGLSDRGSELSRQPSSVENVSERKSESEANMPLTSSSKTASASSKAPSCTAAASHVAAPVPVSVLHARGRAISPDAAERGSGSGGPRFLLPPFELPLLLPLQLQTLLLLHLLLLALRPAPALHTLLQQLLHSVLMLQAKVRKCVEFVECTSTSALEMLEEVLALHAAPGTLTPALHPGAATEGDSACSRFEGEKRRRQNAFPGDERRRLGAAADPGSDEARAKRVAFDELFACIGVWVEDMRREGDACGRRYAAVEAQVRQLVDGFATLKRQEETKGQRSLSASTVHGAQREGEALRERHRVLRTREGETRRVSSATEPGGGDSGAGAESVRVEATRGHEEKKLLGGLEKAEKSAKVEAVTEDEEEREEDEDEERRRLPQASAQSSERDDALAPWPLRDGKRADSGVYGHPMDRLRRHLERQLKTLVENSFLDDAGVSVLSTSTPEGRSRGGCEEEKEREREGERAHAPTSFAAFDWPSGAAWPLGSRADASALTNEILDFLFLSSDIATTHAKLVSSQQRDLAQLRAPRREPPHNAGGLRVSKARHSVESQNTEAKHATQTQSLLRVDADETDRGETARGRQASVATRFGDQLKDDGEDDELLPVTKAFLSTADAGEECPAWTSANGTLDLSSLAAASLSEPASRLWPLLACISEENVEGRGLFSRVPVAAKRTEARVSSAPAEPPRSDISEAPVNGTTAKSPRSEPSSVCSFLTPHSPHSHSPSSSPSSPPGGETVPQTPRGGVSFEEEMFVFKLLTKSLDGLRRVDYLLSCICSFWDAFDVALTRLLQMQQLPQTLLGVHQAVFQRRARERLRVYVAAWEKMQAQCRVYVHLAKRREEKLAAFGLQIQSTADQVDAIRALS